MLDDVDWAILLALQENARLSYTELGRRVGLTAPAVAERVRRLEQNGVITGYRAELNLERVGRPVLALVRVASREDRSHRLDALVRELPEILECHRVTGSDCYVLKVAVASVRELEYLIDCLSTCGHPTTSVVLSSPVTWRAVPPPTRSTAPAGDGRTGSEQVAGGRRRRRA